MQEHVYQESGDKKFFGTLFFISLYILRRSLYPDGHNRKIKANKNKNQQGMPSLHPLLAQISLKL
jgi:hypothetical protein